MTTRRKALIALGAGALTAPFVSFAQQQGKVWRVGVLSLRPRPDSFDSGAWGQFRRGMRELGYVEGKNLLIEWRFAEGKRERLPALAAELLQSKVDVIVTGGTPPTGAAQRTTTEVPIVMGSSGDPISSGLIKTLARPGGNITGLTNISGDLSPKHLQMLIDMVPKLLRVAVLVNPNNSAFPATLKNVQDSGQRVTVGVLPLEARSLQEIANAFVTMSREKAGAIIVHSDGIFLSHVHEITDAALKYRLPLIAAPREFAEAGGLMSCGPDFDDLYRRAATYVDKIFKGAKPADLPVEQPTKYELIINGKTAKALGLKIPQSLLISADKVIE